MATDLAPVTPEVLRWARESLGVTVEEAARRAAVPQERLLAWERGDEEPTVAKLRSLGMLYQRPLSVFFLPEPPRAFDSLRDFRRLPGTSDHAWSRSLHKVYRRALEQQAVAEELLSEGDEDPRMALPSATTEQAPEDAGRTTREYLGVSLARQMAFTRPEDAFNEWLRAVEALGIMVLRTSDVERTEMRGFSLSSGIPVIVVNALDFPRGQIFTLLHEFAHLMLRAGGLCDLLEPNTFGGRKIEAWCNATTAAALMPRESFKSHTADIRRESDVTDEVLQRLAARYSVSREAVLRRFVTLGVASMKFYLDRRMQFQESYEEVREEQRAKRRDSKGGPPPYRMTIRDRGRPYVRLVVDAYHRDALTASSVSRLLALKVKHLPALERELR